jgi:hypothetical protein
VQGGDEARHTAESFRLSKSRGWRKLSPAASEAYRCRTVANAKQLAEAMATGFDPLHLAEVFGISEQTAIRCAVNARQLTRPADQEAAPGTGRQRIAAPQPIAGRCHNVGAPPRAPGNDLDEPARTLGL